MQNNNIPVGRIMAAIMAAGIIAMVQPVLADGMFLAPPESFMYEPVQQAFLEWDEDNSSERLTILPGFQGDATDFAWIVPVPSVPQLETADRQLFYDLDSVSHAQWRNRDGQWDCMQQDVYPDAASGGVEIIGGGLVGYFQTMIIASDNAPALLDSLTGWGFLHDENIEAATAAIDDYVQRSWYFVTMQVDSTALAEEYGDYYDDYYYYPYYGGLDPICLTFASDEPIYPMKISAYSAAAETQVHLYVKADHRMTFEGADTYYANRFTSGELASYSYLGHLTANLQPGDFLTKLRRVYSPAQMTEDVVLRRADTDDEFRIIRYSGWPVTTILLLGGPVVWQVWRKRRRPSR